MNGLNNKSRYNRKIAYSGNQKCETFTLFIHSIYSKKEHPPYVSAPSYLQVTNVFIYFIIPTLQVKNPPTRQDTNKICKE